MKEKIVVSIMFLGIAVIAFEFLGGADWLIAKAEAQVTTQVIVRCNNDNFAHSPYCNGRPVMVDGHFTNKLDTGAEWAYTRLGDGIIKFMVQDAYWYVIDGKAYWVDTDLQAYSIYWYGAAR